MSGRINQHYRYFLYQEEKNAAMLSLKLALDSSLNFSLKSTIVNDNAMNFALAELLAPASVRAEESFDDLMIPFRCLAADIFTQEEIVLRNGHLSEAIRASFNVPLVFRPIKVNNKYLFDGGLYNNFPVNIARQEFNPDVVIGVNVSSKTYTRYPYEQDELLIANPLIYLLLSKSDSSQIDSKGVYIQPKLNDYSVLDFSPVDTLLKAGYHEALSKMEEIKAKVCWEQPQGVLEKKRNSFRNQCQPLKINSVAISGLKPAPRRYVSRIFRLGPNDLNLENVKKRFFRLAESDKFDLLYPYFR
ncbi:MAG: hypothetical protein HC880_09705 [Bacteroidia bacterium]|nr:hypothetical protein [Bacteroidia bacterium]